MPIYGEAKKKQMARSILPAKASARKGARWRKRMLKQQERARVRDELHSFSANPDAMLGESKVYRSEMSQARAERRSRDKLAHFQRWAEAIVKEEEIPVENRKGYFQSMLPKGLIGEHAISHLSYMFQEDTSTCLCRRNKNPTKEQLQQKLEYICDNSLLGEFNEFIKMKHKHKQLIDGWVEQTWDWDNNTSQAGSFTKWVPDYRTSTVQAPTLYGKQYINEYLRTIFAGNHRHKTIKIWWKVKEDKEWGPYNDVLAPQIDDKYHPEWYNALCKFNAQKRAILRSYTHYNHPEHGPLKIKSVYLEDTVYDYYNHTSVLLTLDKTVERTTWSGSYMISLQVSVQEFDPNRLMYKYEIY